VDGEGSEGRPASEGRRQFLKKLAVGAFIVPVVSSFTLDAAASAAGPKSGTTQKMPNQLAANQRMPNQRLPNQQTTQLSQWAPNQLVPIQQMPNQQMPNQHAH
jgi:hypothetical protein